MSGYLDNYGVQDARRERFWKRVALVFCGLLFSAVVGYFLLRNYAEEKQFDLFVRHLRNKDYAAAYALWGCTADNPCRDYRMEQFLEDWGPAGTYGDISKMRVTTTRSCSDGIIKILSFGSGEEVNLWIGRRDKTIGHAPWPVCNPRIQLQ